MSTAAVEGRLEGKVAIITGGAAGIGEATVRLFTKHGAKVIIADIADDAGEALAQSLSQTFIHCNVTKEQDLSAAVDLAIEKHGKLDIIFNNAGILDERRTGWLNQHTLSVDPLRWLVWAPLICPVRRFSSPFPFPVNPAQSLNLFLPPVYRHMQRHRFRR